MTLTLEEARRQALAGGYEIVIDGKSFNKARAVVQAAARPKVAAVVAQPPPAPPAPTPAPPPSITADDVARLLADRDAAWQTQSDRVTQAFARAIESIPQPIGRTPSRWVFKPKYDMRGAIETLTAVPQYD